MHLCFMSKGLSRLLLGALSAALTTPHYANHGPRFILTDAQLLGSRPSRESPEESRGLAGSCFVR